MYIRLRLTKKIYGTYYTCKYGTMCLCICVPFHNTFATYQSTCIYFYIQTQSMYCTLSGTLQVSKSPRILRFRGSQLQAKQHQEPQRPASRKNSRLPNRLLKGPLFFFRFGLPPPTHYNQSQRNFFLGIPGFLFLKMEGHPGGDWHPAICNLFQIKTSTLWCFMVPKSYKNTKNSSFFYSF